jgi:hypothetical protein
MVAKIDAHQLARVAKKGSDELAGEGRDKQEQRQKKWLSYRNEALLTRIW